MEVKKRKTPECVLRATAKYDAANTVQMRMKLNINTDQDIINRLNTCGNKQGYIKKLIREDIVKSYIGESILDREWEKK